MRDYRAIIVDDQQSSIDHLLVHFQKITQVKVEDCFTDPFRALNYVRVNPVDLVILDIDFGERINGFDWMSAVTKTGLKFIMYTGFKQFEDEGYSRNVVDVLLKPVSFARFVAAIHRLDANIRLEDPHNNAMEFLGDSYDYFMIRKDGKWNKQMVKFKDIIYIQSQNGVLLIHLSTDQDVLFSNSSFHSVCEILPRKWFKQCSRSIIFNVNFFHSFRRNSVRLKHVKNEIKTGDPRLYADFRSFLDHNSI